MASRPNSLARTTSVRLSRPRASRSRINCRDRRVNGLLHHRQPLVAILMAVPIAEGNVLGGHLDVARAGFPQAARQQAALPEAAGIVGGEVLLRLGQTGR